MSKNLFHRTHIPMREVAYLRGGPARSICLFPGILCQKTSDPDHRRRFLLLPPKSSRKPGGIRRDVVRVGAGGAHITPNPAARPEFIREATAALAATQVQWPEAVQAQLLRDVMDELFGFGPIQPLLEDPSVTEVMVNRADRVYVERAGKPLRTNIVFDDDAHVMRIIDRIIQPFDGA